MATRKYLNAKKVPQIFVASGATQFGDPEHYPWTIGWQVSYQIEGRVYARYILETKADAKIAVLYQNDDSGRDFLKASPTGWAANPANWSPPPATKRPTRRSTRRSSHCTAQARRRCSWLAFPSSTP